MGQDLKGGGAGVGQAKVKEGRPSWFPRKELHSFGRGCNWDSLLQRGMAVGSVYIFGVEADEMAFSWSPEGLQQGNQSAPGLSFSKTYKT